MMGSREKATIASRYDIADDDASTLLERDERSTSIAALVIYGCAKMFSWGNVTRSTLQNGAASVIRGQGGAGRHVEADPVGFKTSHSRFFSCKLNHMCRSAVILWI